MLGALRHRDFRLLWIGQAVSLTGDGIYLVAIAWLVYDISNEPGALAIVGFAWTLPQVAGLLLAGVLSDRFERRRLLVIADLIRFVAIGAIAALAFAGRPIELWHVVLLVVVYGLGAGAVPAGVHGDRAGGRPARGAAAGQRAARADGAARDALRGAGARRPPDRGCSAWGRRSWSTRSRSSSPPLAVMLHSPRGRRRAPSRGSMWRDLREGFAYVRAHAWLWGTLVGAALFLLVTLRAVRGAAAVHHPQRPRTATRRRSAPCSPPAGWASILAAVLLEPHRPAAPAHDLHVDRLGGRDALYVGLAVAGAAWQMCLIAFLVASASATAGMVVWNTLMNTLVPAEMLGRVSSFDWFVSIGLTPLSFAITGPGGGAARRAHDAGAGGHPRALRHVLSSCSCPGVRDPERAAADRA